jgi:hypothetical protein
MDLPLSLSKEWGSTILKEENTPLPYLHVLTILPMGIRLYHLFLKL